MARQPRLARRFFDRYEPVHAVTYFAPEARTALDALGYRGFWMGYFAARSAPLGVAAPPAGRARQRPGGRPLPRAGGTTHGKTPRLGAKRGGGAPPPAPLDAR